VVRGARGFEHAETSWIIRYRSMARRWRGPGHCTFVGILASIALGPLLFPKIWHAHYGKIALA
jgi:hypothetical protein